jgi:uroporphyrinogen-III synthase
VGVTADRRAGEQAELLARRGARVVRAPTIRLLPLGPDEAVRAVTVALIEDPPDILVVNTGVGVRAWLALADAWGLSDALVASLGRACVLARGPKAAGALLTAGLHVDWRAPSARLDEIVEHLVGRGVAGCRVALQLDGSGDGGEAAERLRRAGADVVAVAAYRWGLPEDLRPARRLAVAVAERRVDAVTFTAAPAVENLFAIAANAGVADAVREAFREAVAAVCVGPVCAAAAVGHGVAAPVQPSRPRLGAMVQALAVHLEGRRRVVRVDGRTVEVRGALVAGGGAEVVLAGRERAVFELLARRPGAVVPRRALVGEIWGVRGSARALEATVGRLRRRLAPVGIGVEAVARRGYRLVPAPS